MIFEQKAEIYRKMRRDVEERDEERGIYSELPRQVIELSNAVERVVADLVDANEDHPTLAYARSDIKSRSGGEILLIPQRRKFHEFDVTTHLDLAAWAAQNYEQAFLPFVDEAKTKKLREFLNRLSEQDKISFSVAAYLHDIEKPFESRRAMDANRPAEKPVEGEEYSVLGEQEINALDGITPDNPSEFRKKMVEYMLSEKTRGDESEIDDLKGVLVNKVNKEKLMRIVDAYSWLDSRIIALHGGESEGIDKLVKLVQSAIKEEKFSREELILGVMVEFCDLFAQGVPPEGGREIEKENEKSVEFCNKLLDGLL